MAHSTSLIPSAYTYLNPDTMISKAAEDILTDLLKKADNRDPDAFDIYVYNDFFNYGILDLIDKTMSTIHTKVVKKNWDEAFVLLEALTIFNDMMSSWPMCDDGTRTKRTNQAFGALLVTVLRALRDDGRLDTTHFPSLECMLRGAAEWGTSMSRMSAGSDYHLVCRAIGQRLFKDKAADVVALEKARVEEWIGSLDAQTQAAVREQIKESEEEKATTAAEGEEKPWYFGGSEDDEDDPSNEYTVSRVWKEYKEHLATCPSKPLRGPGWDISKWSAATKKEFQLGGEDEDDDDF